MLLTYYIITLMCDIMIPVSISEDAMEFITDKLEKSDLDTIVIYFEGFGWGGPKFGIDVKVPKETDDLIYDNEFKIYLEKTAGQFLSDINIVLKKSMFYGKYLSIRGTGGRC